ncbi:MAG: hypothetical protein HYU97_02610 [Deltaproteobacteria bacterium]|nr:hypothetical protein [Deltaproteobacteria bacterium]
MKKVFIDSDIFVRDLRYPRDSRTEANQKFIEKIQARKGLGVTSIFNLLEICGILSFNLSAEELLQLYGDFINYYKVQILFPADANGNLQYDIIKIFGQIQKKQSLGDAQVSYVAERFASQLSCFVSWNAPHFTEKLPLPIKTPEKYLLI